MFIATLIKTAKKNGWEKLRNLDDRSRWKNIWIVGLEEVPKKKITKGKLKKWKLKVFIFKESTGMVRLIKFYWEQ